MIPIVIGGVSSAIGLLLHRAKGLPTTDQWPIYNQGHQAGTASALMGVLTFSLASIIGAALGFWQSASALPILTLMAICGVGGLLWHRLVLPKTVVVSP